MRLIAGPSGLSEACARSSGVDSRNAIVLARVLRKRSRVSAGVQRPVGVTGGGACALWLRSGIIAKTMASIFAVSRSAAPGGDFMTLSVTFCRRKSSTRTMCSSVSATDQRSGAGLNFISASESPPVAATTPSRVSSRYVAALSLSPCVSVWPSATPHKSRSVQKFKAVFYMVASPGFNRESKDPEDYKYVTCEMQVK